MSDYHPLTEQEAISFARTIPDLFAAQAQLQCREIGDGNLNLVFHIRDEETGRSVILKQALPYAKVVGESWPLTLDRARIESEVLQIEGSLCPDLVPHVYTYVPELALTVMEDLSDHTIMRRGLIERNVYPNFAAHIGRFLAHTLFFTSDFGMNQQEKKLRAKQFTNPELCKITEDLIFADPYYDAETNSFDETIRDAVEALWSDTELHLQVAKLRHRFLTHGQALLHGDLHTGSIFITAESTKVIDPEFAYYGPMGFDIGAVIANLLLNYAGQEGWSTDEASRSTYRTWLLDTARDVWATFSNTFDALWDEHLVDRTFRTPGYRDYFKQQLLHDTIGFAGSKMVRRVIGLAHVADIDKLQDPNAKERAQRLALAIGQAWIKQHEQLHTLDAAIAIVEQAVQAAKGATQS